MHLPLGIVTLEEVIEEMMQLLVPWHCQYLGSTYVIID